MRGKKVYSTMLTSAIIFPQGIITVWFNDFYFKNSLKITKVSRNINTHFAMHVNFALIFVFS